MLRLCVECDTQKEHCSKCFCKHVDYCGKHANWTYLKNKWHCKSCFTGPLCYECKDEEVFLCSFCNLKSDNRFCLNCSKTKKMIVVNEETNTANPACEKCFKRNHCLQCDQHKKLIKCSICKEQQCKACGDYQKVNISPQILFQGIQHAVARFERVCKECFDEKGGTQGIQDLARARSEIRVLDRPV